MDTLVQKQLDRIEAALTTLIESITSFNPSLPAAQDLLDADSDLTLALDKCTSLHSPNSSSHHHVNTLPPVSTHQKNAAHLQALRTQSTTLTTHLKTTLSTLSTTRATILS